MKIFLENKDISNTQRNRVTWKLRAIIQAKELSREKC